MEARLSGEGLAPGLSLSERGAAWWDVMKDGRKTDVWIRLVRERRIIKYGVFAHRPGWTFVYAKREQAIEAVNRMLEVK